MKTLLIASFVVSAVLLGVGLTFLVFPDLAIASFAHTAQGVPHSFGGRYIGLAILLAVFATLGDYRALSIFSAVGGLLGFIDAGIYLIVGNSAWNITQHVIAGCAGILAAFIFWIIGERLQTPGL